MGCGGQLFCSDMYICYLPQSDACCCEMILACCSWVQWLPSSPHCRNCDVGPSVPEEPPDRPLQMPVPESGWSHRFVSVLGSKIGEMQDFISDKMDMREILVKNDFKPVIQEEPSYFSNNQSIIKRLNPCYCCTLSVTEMSLTTSTVVKTWQKWCPDFRSFVMYAKVRSSSGSWAAQEMFWISCSATIA